MPQTISHYTVFIASPSDVSEERNIIEKVVGELNQILQVHFSIQLDIIRWEKNAYPNFGNYPQDVINNEIPENYDLFIGLMWKRFGSPTKNANSGTEEEFIKAYNRFKENSKSVKIMFYFNNSPIPQADIDFDQIKFVRDFKISLGEKGGLYWEYNSLEEFEKLVKNHINNQVRDLHKQQQDKDFEISHSELQSDESEIEDLPGLFDSLDTILNDFPILTESTERISESIKELTNKITERTIELTSAKGSTDIMNYKENRKVLDRLADDIDNFVARLKPEVDIVKSNYLSGFEAAVNLFSVSKDLNEDSLEEVKETLDTFIHLKDQVTGAYDSMSEFKNTLKRLPRFTTKFSKSKNKAEETLKELLNTYREMINLLNSLKPPY